MSIHQSPQTIFPRVNFIKDRKQRFFQRAKNGRIYGDNFHDLDDLSYYPPVNGALSFSDALPFPVDLGPDVSTPIIAIYDLREDDGVTTTYDLI